MNHSPRRADIISEISTWSIEAKEEDNDRYFYHFEDVDLLEQGQKNYVIGRKGTGKTAIAEYINGKSSPDRFSKVLSFGNFPFNILYELSNDEYTKPNQYITIWEYVIYNCICSMMATNEQVSLKCPLNLKDIFEIDIEKALSKSIKKMTSPGFGFNLFGVGASKSSGQLIDINSTWREKVNGICEFIKSYCDESTYYVIFDALDEDYKDILEPDRKQNYFELLVSLFKAAQNVRLTLSGLPAKIIPLIFIRDDIFDLCRDPDKNKWLDRSVKLLWDTDSLASLIAFRLSRAADENGKTNPFDQAWKIAFSSRHIRLNSVHQRKEDAFKFMLRSTFHRPRDIISYIRECASIAVKRGLGYIPAALIKQADESHSDYMRREIIDEVHSIIDDIAEILDIFSEIRKPILSIEEFSLVYNNYCRQSIGKTVLTSIEILKLLYHFNVIGNVTTGNHQVFAYNTHKKSINIRENICVHRGLLKCLHIL